MSAGKPVFAVISQGCAANFGDGERIARILTVRENAQITFELPENLPGNAPDAIYLNVCTVKGNAGALKLLRKALETFPEVPIHITGCAPKDFREEARKITDKIAFTSLEEIASLEQGKAAAVILERSDRITGTLRESPYIESSDKSNGS